MSGGLINIRRLALTHGQSTQGGAIFNDVAGFVVLEDVAVTRNSVVTPGALQIAYGGGIINKGTLTLSRVTVANNSAEGGGGAAAGGIYNSGTFTATNSTISDNSATGHGNFSVTGGGVYNLASTTLISATVASNTVTATGAGAGSGGNITLVAGGSTATLKNTLVAYGAAPSAANCFNGGGGSTFTSQGGNLEATAPSQCGLSGPPGSDLVGADPLLGLLADNGGQTDTRALGDGSPALDAVVTANCPEPSEDQRLVARPQGSLCDVGAFERAVVGGPPAAGPTGPSTGTPPASPTPPASGPTVTGPAGNPLGLPSNRKCVDRRKFSFRLHHPAATKIVDVVVFINGKRTRHLRARAINRVTLTRLPQKKFQVKIVATQDSGGQLISVRTYKGCKKSKPRTRRGHSHR